MTVSCSKCGAIFRDGLEGEQFATCIGQAGWCIIVNDGKPIHPEGKYAPMLEPLVYSNDRYSKLLEETIANIKKLGELKGGEYAGDVDRLANFRRNAEECGVTMETIWRVYCGKHWDAISQYVRDRQTGKHRKRLEPLSGRCDDIIVYMVLFKAMLEEADADGLKQPGDVIWNR